MPIFHEPNLAMRERAGAASRSEDEIGRQQRPRTKRRSRGRLTEDQRSCRYFRKLLLDERRATMELEAVQRPIPLHGAKLPCSVRYRSDLDPLWLKPDVLRPCSRARWA